MLPGRALCQSNNSSPILGQTPCLGSKSSNQTEGHLEIHYNAMCLVPVDDSCRHCKQRVAVPASWDTTVQQLHNLLIQKSTKDMIEGKVVANGCKQKFIFLGYHSFPKQTGIVYFTSIFNLGPNFLSTHSLDFSTLPSSMDLFKKKKTNTSGHWGGLLGQASDS